jgi:hypothetical protein
VLDSTSTEESDFARAAPAWVSFPTELVKNEREYAVFEAGRALTVLARRNERHGHWRVAWL